jgi:hypothetical protein
MQDMQITALDPISSLNTNPEAYDFLKVAINSLIFI